MNEFDKCSHISGENSNVRHGLSFQTNKTHNTIVDCRKYSNQRGLKRFKTKPLSKHTYA